MKGLTTPLSRWLRGSYLFVLVRWTRAWSPTGLIPWFSKTEGNTYATLLHHPLLSGEIQRSAQEVARRIFGAVAGEAYARSRQDLFSRQRAISCAVAGESTQKSTYQVLITIPI